MSGTEFLDEFKKGMMGAVFTAAIAQIEIYDPVTNKADIVVMPEMNLVKSVPVGMPQTDDYFIRIPYQKGDHVIVVFSHRDIDPIIFDNGKVPTKRVLSENDAMIVTGLNIYTDPLPDVHTNDLVIAMKDLTSKIVMKKDTGDIIVESAGNLFLGDEDAVEGVPLGDKLKKWLDGHTHPGEHGETGPPSTESPAPSEWVKTV